jgi:hypothetical protein
VSIESLLGEHWGGGGFIGDFDRKLRFCFNKRPPSPPLLGLQAMCKRRRWKWASLSVGGPVGGPGGEVHLLGISRETVNEVS